MTDPSVVRTAYTTAKSMGASGKVMLALFEAGIVESNFENLTGGDRDSVGFLQQRASQGWTGLRDVAGATREFVNKATPIQDRYATAGQLAQAVQRSAFPLKYDAVKAKAEALLAQQGGSGDVQLLGNPLNPSDSSLKKLSDTISNKGMWIRIGLFAAGALAVLYALFQISESSLVDVVKKVSG